MATPSPDPDAIATRADYAAALTALREDAGFTVREIARRLDARPGTIGGWLSGRHLPPASQLAVLTRLLRECNVTDERAVESWLTATARLRATTDRRSREHRPPFRGLVSFEADDADLFFARDAETDRLIELVRDGEHPAIAVVGPSGSGKSSVLHAGLVAAIRAGRLDSPEHRCSYILITPGTAAVERLSTALDQLIEPGPRILVVDQLEELFTSRYELGERYRFLELLEKRDPGIVVVFGLRADFYAPAAREPVLLSALQDAQVLVGPLDRESVAQTITGPSAEVGTALENGFVDVVLADLGPVDMIADTQAVSSLPLLGYALLATWNRSSGGRLTIEDYRATGGIPAAIERTAESVYAGLSDAGRRTARAVFLRLVTVDVRTVTHRRIRWSELDGLAGAQAREVAREFVESRLLTAFSDGLEVSHEAVLRSWPRLREWIADDSEALRMRRRITDGATDWERAQRDPDRLMRGAWLEEAAEWSAAARDDLALTAIEQDYLDAGIAHADALRRRERRAQRHLRQAFLAVAVLAVVAVVLALVSLMASRAAERNRLAATAARDDALSRQVAQESVNLTDDDPALAAQLALVAFRIAPTDAARAALIGQSVHPVITRRLGEPGPTALATSKDGRLVAVSRAENGSVRLYRYRATEPPEAVGSVPGGGLGFQLFALAFSPDGRLLATGGRDQHVNVWDVSDVQHPRPVAVLTPGFGTSVQTIAFSPDGRTLVAGGSGLHPILRWAIGAGADTPTQLPPPRGVRAEMQVNSVAFDAKGERLVAGGQAGMLLSWPAATMTTSEPVSMPVARAATVNSVAVAPDGRRIYAGESTGQVQVWASSAPSESPFRTLTGATDSPVDVVAVSPDGAEVAAGAADNTVQRWDTSHWDSRAVTHNPGPVTGLRFTADRTSMLWTAADGTLRQSRLDASSLTLAGSAFALSFSRDGTRLAVGTSNEDGNVRVWDVRDRLQPRALTAPLTLDAKTSAVDGTAALRPDGQLLAAGNAAGQVQLWSLRDVSRPTPVAAPFHAESELIEAVAFSPDGRLLAVAGDNRAITLFGVSQPAHPRPLRKMKGRGRMLGLAFSPDGRLIAGANADSHAYVWNITTPTDPQLVKQLGGFRNYVYGVAFSPDGRQLAATSSDHTTHVWRVDRAGRHFAPRGSPLIGPTDYVYSAAFDATGRHLATGSNDGAVRVYDLDDRSRVPQQIQNAVGAPVFATAYSPSNGSLYAGGRGPSVVNWAADTDVYAGQLCRMAGDAITQQEWALYVPKTAYHPPCRT